ncbi:DNA polymerase III subunit chi [Sphingomonas spermidinifaciens]|uniref:DNA polymerase III subunit chi n=1 Tax=Sphingomonas spermidinifaciens TaxID=1141889 RepID=A0A2A4B0L4_9SPHN|nr:DNA polymerase III subunit chi [Sphingomonas spermidinifaciens]PCD01610.1 DNA polymerase III subunit chi [Sphingomonas spermidinifaciens]
MQVDFYHLTLRPLERALPQIAEKVLAGGARLLIVSGDEGQRAALDRALWTYAPASFLPHGIAGEGDDAVQPVLIAGEVAAGNGARMVAIVDGAWRDEALTFDRAFHFFGEDQVAAARAAWKGLADRDGVERRYWKQTERGWEQAA